MTPAQKRQAHIRALEAIGVKCWPFEGEAVEASLSALRALEPLAALDDATLAYAIQETAWMAQKHLEIPTPDSLIGATAFQAISAALAAIRGAP